MPLTPPQELAPATHVGIVGGGQLARMMAEAAPRMGLKITVLDPTPDCPAREFAAQLIGEFDDPAQLAALARACDVVTLDIEAVTASCLGALERCGNRVAPSAQVLGTIQDKFRQKEFLRQHDLPTSDFRALVPGDHAALASFGLPCVMKARRHGYDGRGVKVIRASSDAEALLKVPCLVERLVDIDKELAVMVARNWHGEIATYPVVEAQFDPRANILDLIQAPAGISAEIAALCQALACRIVECLDGIGIFGVEFFLTRSGEILINEISPRPHNSGHYTIEACTTSQFEQHLRAVTGRPLGPTTLLRPAASFNLLGEPGAHGEPLFQGLARANDTRGAAVHLYGKRTVRPFRKMGHVTVTATTLAEALATAHALQGALKVMGGGA